MTLAMAHQMAQEAPTESAEVKSLSLRLNAVANTTGNLVFFAAVFLVTPLAIRSIGEEGWGIWQLVGAASSYALLLNLGLGTAVHYQVSFHAARGDYRRIAQAIANTRLYFCLAAGVMLLLLFAAGRTLVVSLVQADRVEIAWLTLALTVALTAVTLPLRTFPSILAGLQRYDLQGAFQIAAAMVLAVGVWSGFRVGMGLVGFAILMTIAPVLPALLSRWSARRLLPASCFRTWRVDLRYFGEMVRYSVSTLMYTGGAVVLYQTMKFIASWRCGGVEAAGHMGLVVNVVQTLAIVFTPLLGVLHARVAQMHGSGRIAEIGPFLERALDVSGLLVMPALVFLILETTVLFQAWVGRSVDASVIPRLAETTRFMLVGQGAYILCLPCYYTLLGVGEHRIPGWGMLAAALANAGGGWFAAGFSHRIEVLGIVFGILMSVLALAITVPAALRRFPLPVKRILWSAGLFPLLVTAPGAAAIVWKPKLGNALLDLVSDAALFGVASLPGLELGRRRMFRDRR